MQKNSTKFKIFKFLINFIPCKKTRKVLREKLQPKSLRNQMIIPKYPIQEGLIKPEDKILIIAPHPDDEVIGCGGVIAKYKGQVDVLCINSSGVKYDWNTETEEEIAQIRCDEFYNAMKIAGINKSYIAKIWGTPPMFEQIESHFKDYLSRFDFKGYDFIFIPHKLDGHREHRFIGNCFFKKLLKKSGYKKSLKIIRYEVWGTMAEPNYYEDITDFVEEKRNLIRAYISRSKAHYDDRILALNYYRAITNYFNSTEKSAEAYFVQGVQEYIKEKDDKSWMKLC